MKIGYLYLLLTIFFDSIGISLLNKANGVTDLKYLLLGLFFLSIGSILLSLSFKSIDMTIANATFAGLSSLLVALMGCFYFDEKYTLFQYFCITTIVFGVFGLNLTGVSK
ncbi:MAG: hypothetical protein HEQ27_08290 [Dolichospermum sp. JUN01]|nr:hypothetical protein [Dolichospermum sp. JUN01]